MRSHQRSSAAQVVVAALASLLVCGSLSPAATGHSPSSGRYAALDAYVRDRMLATHTPGLAYAVVGPDGVLHQRSWGTDGRGEPVTAQTPFLWGSVAKPVTATAVMTLVQSGRLHLGDRVTEYLPGFRFGGASHASNITLRHLLGHTSGLPGSATLRVTDCYDVDCPEPVERLDQLADIRPRGAPGTTYAYTSANYLILAAVIESVTGRPFAAYLQTAVLDPAGMHSAITDTASAREHRLPPGHQLLWSVPAATADGYDNNGASYGYLGGDLHDLAAFAALQLRRGKALDGSAVLTPESVQTMRQEQRLGPAGVGTGYGLGWRVGGLEAPLRDAIWHTGATPGYSAMLFLLPGRERALVLQQNLYGTLQDASIMQVGFGAARILAGGEPPASISATTYHLTVWGITALAIALILAAGRSVLLLRRSARPASRRRRITETTACCVVGALPWAGGALLASQMSVGRMMTWLPDAFIALCVAAAAGAAVIVFRLAVASRGGSPRP